MKKLSIFLATMLFFAIQMNAQDLTQALNQVKSKITDIQIDKVNNQQALEVLDESKGKIRFISTTVDDKGKSVKESYEYYVSDIDKNTVIRKVLGKKISVNMSTINKQKFIKYYKEDVFVSYVETLDILVSDADAASSLADDFKKAIPLVKTSTLSFASAREALTWLKANIGNVTTKTGKSEQAFGFDDQKEYLVNLVVKTTLTSGATTEELYSLNVADVNKNGIRLVVSGATLSVQVENIGNNKYIRYLKNGVVQNYTGDFAILSEDIDHARQVISAFTVAVENSKPVYPAHQSVQQACDYVKSKIVDDVAETKTITQKMDFEMGSGTKATLTVGEPDSKGAIVNHQYDFYLADVDKSSISFKVVSKKVLLVFNILNKVDLVKHLKDGVPQNYQDGGDVVCADIESAREIVEALKFAVNGSELPAVTWASPGKLAEFLNSAVKGETVRADKFELSLTADPAEPFKTVYVENKTDAKGITTEGSLVFYPFMLDPNSIKIVSAGKYLNVTGTVKEKNAFIRKMKGETPQGFTPTLEIMAFDAKQARDIAGALKFFAANFAPKEKDWSDKGKNMDYVTKTVGDFSNANKEVQQKLEMVGGDPCKLSLTITTTDDKGKTLVEINEFSLSDMNKLMVEYKIVGSNVAVVLICKNKEKYVKGYKNGVQQAFASDVRILEDDVETARNLADALKATIIQCEK